MNEIQTEMWKPQDSSDDFAVRINSAHDACIGSAETTVSWAVEAGNLLREKKKKVGHGCWTRWVEDNCRFSISTAQDYMKASKNWARPVFENGHPKSLRQILEAIEGPSKDEDDEEATGGSSLFVKDDSLQERTETEDDVCDEEDDPNPIPEPVKSEEKAPPPWTASEKERRKQVERGVTVLANMSHDHRLVAWAQNERRFIKIDRTTPFGNPMRLDWMNDDREAVVNWYLEHWIPFVAKHLPTDDLLNGKVLGCWCYPESCHGDSIIEFLSGVNNED